MNRRSFIAASTTVSLSGAVATARTGNQYIELRFYNLSGAEQSNRIANFLEREHLPLTRRLGVSVAGYFERRETPTRGPGRKSPDAPPEAPCIMTLTAFDSWAAVEAAQTAEHADKQFNNAVEELTAQSPAFDRVESCLLRAFDGLRKIEVPPAGPISKSRIFDLRIAESPSFGAAAAKREQFNSGEIQIFRDCGLHPLLFGQTLYGSRMPNLRFMVWYEDEDARAAAWDAFNKNPDWAKMRNVPRWAKAVFRYTDTFLRPLPFSPIR